jgi:CRISPR-associated protein Csx3
MSLILNTHHESDYTIISWSSINEVFETQELRQLSPPNPIAENFAHKGVILSGRGPVWLYCFLTHFYHTTKFVATYDPRLQGAVVVESHGSEYKVGDIIPVDSSLIATNA